MVYKEAERSFDLQGHICRGSVRIKFQKLFPASLQELLCKKKKRYLNLAINLGQIVLETC